ncbi:DprA-like DNA recombination-mediator protein [Erwinia phage vB_EamM_Caitlin]|uniref:DprA-like DNA recombination-mediator protein n=1 Tax=Erwinia phage vB_EamM_Caitlin TaxID=1883379 RepID=UPI00081C5004|nr:DprA-like DNA recombination-mediator protein [Erwinia phage vB_EamM_Caitlin]ANZ48395.1 hypothetical protein CAITLIN_100 [Erwinia phage vB_EamM_Caitlin]
MSTVYKIAVIGSRETEAETMHEMYTNLLRGFNMLHARGIEFEYTSGGCWKGPDQLQFQFARQWRQTYDQDTGKLLKLSDKFICYLPDDKKLWLAKQHPNVEFRVIPQDERYREIVRNLHPYPEKLQEFAWALHGRNLNIIMGDTLDSPVDAVYFSAPLNKHGEPTGGTAMGVKYAKQCGIPCFNHAEDHAAWLESLRLL